jgi:hypothetical protein
MKNKHHLVLASIVLLIETIRFATKLVVLLGMIFNYSIAYATNLGIKVRAKARYMGICAN